MSQVSEVSVEDWALWRSFNTMHQQLARELDRRLQQDAGISQSDYAVLVTLFEAPDRRLRTGELAELLGWEKSRVSHQVSRMEARDLLERTECDTDARGTWIGLTTAGRRTLLAAMSDHAAAIRRFFLDPLDPGQKRALHDAAQNVITALDPDACRIAEEKGMLGAADRSREPAA
jgi:DNA-binding MarR family transcriptional regulator